MTTTQEQAITETEPPPRELTDLDGVQCIDRLVTQIKASRYDAPTMLEYVKTVDIALVRYTVAMSTPKTWHDVSRQFAESLTDDQARMALLLLVLSFMVGRAQ